MPIEKLKGKIKFIGNSVFALLFDNYFFVNYNDCSYLLEK